MVFLGTINANHAKSKWIFTQVKIDQVFWQFLSSFGLLRDFQWCWLTFKPRRYCVRLPFRTQLLVFKINIELLLILVYIVQLSIWINFSQGSFFLIIRWSIIRTHIRIMPETAFLFLLFLPRTWITHKMRWTSITCIRLPTDRSATISRNQSLFSRWMNLSTCQQIVVVRIIFYIIIVVFNLNFLTRLLNNVGSTCWNSSSSNSIISWRRRVSIAILIRKLNLVFRHSNICMDFLCCFLSSFSCSQWGNSSSDHTICLLQSYTFVGFRSQWLL